MADRDTSENTAENATEDAMTDTAEAVAEDAADGLVEGEVEQVPFSWKRVLGLFAPHRARVAAVIGLVLVVAVLGVVNPLLIRVMFDRGLFPVGGGVDLPLVISLAGIMLAVTVASGALGVWRTIATNRLGQDVLRDLRERLYTHLQHLSLSFYSGARTGDLQSRITSDVGGIQNAVTSTVSNILSNVVTFTSALIAMLVLSPQLTALALATIPLFVVATRWVGARRERYTAATQAATADMSVVTQETLSVSGITLAKLFGRQDREVERFREANARLAEAATAQQVIGQAFFTVIQAFMGATPVLIYLVAGWLLDRGRWPQRRNRRGVHHVAGAAVLSGGQASGNDGGAAVEPSVVSANLQLPRYRARHRRGGRTGRPRP